VHVQPELAQALERSEVDALDQLAQLGADRLSGAGRQRLATRSPSSL
jgi:hypothetical protein